MRKLLAATALSLALMGGAAYFRTDEVAVRQHDMLNPSVQVETADSFGSGTIVHSGEDGVYVVTNHHVVAEALAAAKTGESVEVKVRNWLFLGDGTDALPIEIAGHVVASNPDQDLALIKIDDPRFRARTVARLASNDDVPREGEEVFAVGGGLGYRPFTTIGTLSLRTIFGHGTLEDGKILISAAIINGNSGGGAYVKRGSVYELFGVPEAIAVATARGVPVGVPHMGIVIPIKTVREFLSRSGLSIAPKITVAAR